MTPTDFHPLPPRELTPQPYSQVSSVVEIGKLTLKLEQEVRVVETQELIAKAAVTCAGVSVETGRPTKMPPWVAENVRAQCTGGSSGR